MLEQVPNTALLSSGLMVVDAAASDAHGCKSTWMHGCKNACLSLGSIWMQKHMSQPWMQMDAKPMPKMRRPHAAAR